MARALSVSDLLNKKYKSFDFQGDWYDAFENPETTGVWFIWGNSGNGKTSFTLQLCKELTRFGRVAYNSLEEGDAKTMQNAFRKTGMASVKKKLLLLCEPIDELSVRLDKPKSPSFVVIDSWQYAGLSFAKYLEFKKKHKNKLLIFISQADGKQPSGRAAKSVMYDASLKIWVEGYKAFSKGRYIGPNGGSYTIWHEGAALYHGESVIPEKIKNAQNINLDKELEKQLPTAIKQLAKKEVSLN
ncbi:DNA repair protein RadA [Solitalea koreensis]|uniref:AAA+ ATPase domain-containing protein n=1 Tax=Solitalea koreensis TaxID=543615 RepID=A0A521BMV1_9SPHI|nr:DNA repair protein RadA [Solitalea koreensis]SMO48435.1 hypothetical protein SAMN06265350_102347 [Solitalea koreensis]